MHGETPSAPTFGQLLRRYREAAALSQEDLAERAGLSVDAISLLERGGRQRPHRDTVQRLTTALALPPAEQARFTAARRPSQATVDWAGMVTLPLPLTPLLGRDREEAAVTRLLTNEARAGGPARLVTLTGPGGVGKTRLALQVAHDLRVRFSAGVVVVALAALRDPALVPAAIAGALHVEEGRHRTLTAGLVHALSDKEALLLLDNFEQVVAAAPLVTELLGLCPHLRVLVTSRAALRVRGEQDYAVAPLALPSPTASATVEALGHNAAVALFVATAQAVSPDFALTARNAAAVAAICRRLDGLPLALELAAAWSKALPPAALLARLEHRLTVLVDGPRDLPARQQTMRAAIAWSYDLLDEHEQALFRRLAVCLGGCTLQAAQHLSASTGQPVWQQLAALADKSLLMLAPGAPLGDSEDSEEEPRAVMLETIREYGLERLDAARETETVLSRHLAFYLALAEAAEPELRGARQSIWLARLELEHDNLRAALRWAGMSGQAATGLRLSAALWRFWRARGHLGEGRRWLREMLELTGADETPLSTRIQALTGAAMLAIEHGAYDEAEDFSGQALVLAHQQGQGRDLGAALTAQGLLDRQRGRYTAATPSYEQALAVARAGDDQAGVATALASLGTVAMFTGEAARARLLFEQGLSLYRALGDTRGVAEVLSALTLDAVSGGLLDRADALGTEALALLRVMGDTGLLAESLFGLGTVAQNQDQDERAASLYEESLALYQQRGDDLGAARSLSALGHLVLRSGNLVRARTLQMEALTTMRRQDSLWGQAMTLTMLGHVELADGALDQAQALLGESAALFQAIGNPLFLSWCLEGLAGVAAAQGFGARAAQLCGARDALLAARGSSLPPAYPASHARTLEKVRLLLGDDARALEQTAGQVLALEHVLAEALRPRR